MAPMGTMSADLPSDCVVCDNACGTGNNHSWVEQMESVSRFEANLLRLLYFFLRREPPERALPLLQARHTQPPCLHSNAVRLVRQALARGCVLLLAQRGGWRKERFLRGERAVTGRLWERTPPAELGLSFSRHALAFLIWITAADPADDKTLWTPPLQELTPADLLLFFFAHEAIRTFAESMDTSPLWTRPPFAGHGLCWLAHPEDFADLNEPIAPDFAPWMSGLGACIMEALQPVLAARWIAVESSKERLTDPAIMLRLGQSQERVLNAFLTAAEQAGRTDLARFLLAAATKLLGPHAHAGMWTGQLKPGGLRLADRTAAYHAAAAFLRQLDRLQQWERRARSVGYFDEGYAASQLWKADWAAHDGDTLAGRAATILRQMDPLRQGDAEEPAATPPTPNPRRTEGRS